ncbi:MAG: MerR family transcriptional regulator, partial [Micromonosporaceae bacterium]
MELAGWTLDELVAQVATRLADGRTGQVSRRVREVPDRRAIRWYTTIGLLDRPRLVGRTGWYGRRHLLQLVAIKRLQAEGKPLAEIQAELAGATDATLRRIARIPADELPRT